MRKPRASAILIYLLGRNSTGSSASNASKENMHGIGVLLLGTLRLGKAAQTTHQEVLDGLRFLLDQHKYCAHSFIPFQHSSVRQGARRAITTRSTNMGQCAPVYSFEASDTIIPDPDIAGIGVIISFALVNGMTIIFTVIALLHVTLDTLHLRGIDLFVHRQLKKIGLRAFSDAEEKQTIKHRLEVLENILLGLSDTQLLTGIAVIIAGYMKCDITIYHSNIVVDLAWFASGTNLSSMAILRWSLPRYPAMRRVRAALLLAMCGLLLSIIILQGHREWYDSILLPAWCLFKETATNVGGGPAVWMGLGIFFVLLGYTSVFLYLFEDKTNIEAFARRYLAFCEKVTRRVKLVAEVLVKFPAALPLTGYQAVLIMPIIISAEVCLVLLCMPPVALFLILIYLMYGMIDSTFVSVIFDLLWFTFGLWTVVQDRYYGRLYMDDSEVTVENSWGFGQLVPMFLVLLPIIAVWDTWYSMIAPACYF